MASVDVDDAPVDEEEPGPAAPTFLCRVCGESFSTRAEVVAHWKTHGDAGARHAAAGRPRRARAPKPPNQVQMGLTLAYGLAGQAFGMWGPAPKEARAAVGRTMAMTAVPAGASLDNLARKTPVYGALRAFFGGASLLDDAAPLAMPLIVGLYAYSPPTARERLRPAMRSMLGLIILQTFGAEEPTAPEAMTPMALPKWIQDMAEGLIPDAPPQEDAGTRSV